MAEKRTSSNVANNSKERGIVIMRIFDAPREFMLKAWTDPERLKRWWGQKTSRHLSAKSISAWAASIYIACDRRRDRILEHRCLSRNS